jgi:YidC/Oxa1 family membrane protein insertase
LSSLSAIWNGFVAALEWALRLCFDFTGNAGLAIIVFTIAIKILFLPLTLQQLRSSREMQKIQPKLADLRKKYAKDKEKLNQETMALYREHGVNPMAGCLPSLIQLPIFFGVYYAVLNLSRLPSLTALISRTIGFSTSAFLGLGGVPVDIWEGLTKGILANQPFLWLTSIGQPDPFRILPILAGVFQLIQQRMMSPKGGASDPQQQAMSNSMMFMPLMIVFIGWNFPAGPVVYWVTQSVFGIVQQYFVSGWGALRDWLPFLPERKVREKEPEPRPQITSEQGEPAERRGWFWRMMDQMSTLQERAEQMSEVVEDEPGTAEESGDGSEPAIPPAPKKRRSRQ